MQSPDSAVSPFVEEIVTIHEIFKKHDFQFLSSFLLQINFQFLLVFLVKEEMDRKTRKNFRAARGRGR
jgi:hypothetical protein